MSEQENVKAVEETPQTTNSETVETQAPETNQQEAAPEENSAKSGDDKNDDAKTDAANGESKPEEKEMLRVRRHEAHTRPKSDPSVLPESDDPKEIRTQVEFYFSNSNLRTDTFLRNKLESEKNTPVDLSVVCSFSRMRRFKPYSAVVAALKESKELIVDGEEGKETICRKVPYDPKKINQADEHSTYIKGFGEESASTQFDLEAFFAKFGTFNSVRLRRSQDKDKVFKGSVFVEWADKETADKFLALDPKPDWKGHPLLIKPKLQYVEEKNQEIRDGHKQPNHRQRGGGRGGRGGRGRDNRKGGDSDDWKKRRDDDRRNGFRDQRGGGRGGRGRGGRGRGRGRGGFNGRDRDDNNQQKEQTADSREIGRPKIHTSEEGAKIMNNKRSRDEDANGEAPPAKKVDNKEAAPEAA